MNVNAANGLLKTLEEPRKNTLIILLAHNARSLPQTVLSRCQTIHINPTYEQTDWVRSQGIEDFNYYDYPTYLAPIEHPAK